MREVSTHGVETEEDWAEVAENPDVIVNNAASSVKRMKVDGMSGDQANSATTMDPLMTAMEVAGMDQICMDNNSAGTDAAGVDQEMAVRDNNTAGMERVMVVFPENCNLSLENKYAWYMALLKQHPECKPLFKEGRNAPYITLNVGQQL